MTHFCVMQRRWISISPLLLLLGLLSGGLQASAQTEADAGIEGDGTSGSSVIGVHRAWLPTESNRPNTGLFIESTGSTKTTSLATGAVILATGVGERGIFAALGGVRYYLLGTDRFGLFASAHAGFTIGSRTGLAGFNILNDPTLTAGLVTMTRLGGTIPVTREISAMVAVAHTLFTNEAGAMPVGIQLGLTMGGGQ
jgi:hypothetical protein